jgi:hypothetical protein
VTPTPIADYAAYQLAFDQPWVVSALAVASAVGVLLGALSVLLHTVRGDDGACPFWHQG